MQMNGRIWLTWEVQRRNRTASRALGARLVELTDAGPRVLRYARSTWKTLSVLVRERPGIVFAQNPSMVLAIVAMTYGRWTGRPVVIDAHNAGVRPEAGRSLDLLARRIMRAAPLTIVSNERLAAFVEDQGGRAAVLPDPLPELPAPSSPGRLAGEFNALFICTWAPDEPYLEVLRAASQVSPGTRIYVTGRSRGREKELGTELPENVELTGFVSDEEFVRLIHAADLVVDLTTWEDCLLCGAYEAVAAERPMLLSDTAALREYFDRGAVYTDNTAADIATKLDVARRRHAELSLEVAELKEILAQRWNRFHDALEAQISLLSTEGQDANGRSANGQGADSPAATGQSTNGQSANGQGADSQNADAESANGKDAKRQGAAGKGAAEKTASGNR